MLPVNTSAWRTVAAGAGGACTPISPTGQRPLDLALAIVFGPQVIRSVERLHRTRFPRPDPLLDPMTHGFRR